MVPLTFYQQVSANDLLVTIAMIVGIDGGEGLGMVVDGGDGGERSRGC